MPSSSQPKQPPGRPHDATGGLAGLELDVCGLEISPKRRIVDRADDRVLLNELFRGNAAQGDDLQDVECFRDIEERHAQVVVARDFQGLVVADEEKGSRPSTSTA